MPTARGWMPCELQHRERFVHLPSEKETPAPVRKLFGERNAGQRIDGVVQIDDELSPLHANNVTMPLNARAGRVETFAQSRAAGLNEDSVPLVARWKCGRGDLRSALLMTLNGTIPARIWRRAPKCDLKQGTLLRPFCRLRVTEVSGACTAIARAMSSVSSLFTATRITSALAKVDRVGGHRGLGKRLIEAIEIGDAHAMLLERRFKPLPGEEDNVAPGQGEAAADVTADPAGSGDGDARATDYHAESLTCSRGRNCSHKRVSMQGVQAFAANDPRWSQPQWINR